MDGVLCGHIHTAADRNIDGIAYYNCGDWVESCTAIVEHFDGRMEVVKVDPHLAPQKANEELPEEIEPVLLG